jgi:cell division protein FtsL
MWRLAMNKRKKSKVALVLTLCVLGYFAYTLSGQEQIIRDKQSQLTSINQKIEDEKSKNAELKKQKDQVNSNEYVEKVAREKLGMVKPDERIFVDVNK